MIHSPVRTQIFHMLTLLNGQAYAHLRGSYPSWVIGFYINPLVFLAMHKYRTKNGKG